MSWSIPESARSKRAGSAVAAARPGDEDDEGARAGGISTGSPIGTFATGAEGGGVRGTMTMNVCPGLTPAGNAMACPGTMPSGTRTASRSNGMVSARDSMVARSSRPADSEDLSRNFGYRISKIPVEFSKISDESTAIWRTFLLRFGVSFV
eukprot:scaffold8013_cov124-Isochrysis_galbana.AAC.11